MRHEAGKQTASCPCGWVGLRSDYNHHLDQAHNNKVPGVDTALRTNHDKLRYDLEPVLPREDMIRVLTYGAKKYKPRNWEKGLPWMECVGSLERHLAAWKRGEDVDSESGCYHLAHVAVNAYFLLEFMRTHPELDDRPKPNEKKFMVDAQAGQVTLTLPQAKPLGTVKPPCCTYHGCGGPATERCSAFAPTGRLTSPPAPTTERRLELE